MALAHGSKTVITINAADISIYVKTSEFTRGNDKHDVTGYNPVGDAHAYALGLGDNTFTMSGNYDSTAGTGPRAVLRPLMDSKAAVTLIRRPEGTGAGKPQDSVSVLVEKYVETNPVDDYIAWSADCQCTGAVNSAVQ